MRREYIYRAFERFWHWTQAFAIILLGVTGFEIHGSISFFGYGQAVAIHNTMAISFMVLICFAIFWHLSTGEWRHYLPTTSHLQAYIDYYVTGIFRWQTASDEKERPEQTQSFAKVDLRRSKGTCNSSDGYFRSAVYVLQISAAV